MGPLHLSAGQLADLARNKKAVSELLDEVEEYGKDHGDTTQDFQIELMSLLELLLTMEFAAGILMPGQTLEVGFEVWNSVRFWCQGNTQRHIRIHLDSWKKEASDEVTSASN